MAHELIQDGLQKGGFLGLPVGGIAIQLRADVHGQAIHLLADHRVGLPFRTGSVALDGLVIDLNGKVKAREIARAIRDVATSQLLLLLHSLESAGGRGAGDQDEAQQSQQCAQQHPTQAVGRPVGIWGGRSVGLFRGGFHRDRARGWARTIIRREVGMSECSGNRTGSPENWFPTASPAHFLSSSKSGVIASGVRERTGDPRNPFGPRVTMYSHPANRAAAAVTASSKSEKGNCSAS